MQKVIVRKLHLESKFNDIDLYTHKASASSECKKFENIIQQEIDEGWKISSMNVSYDKGWGCHVAFFVLEKEDEME